MYQALFQEPGYKSGQNKAFALKELHSGGRVDSPVKTYDNFG